MKILVAFTALSLAVAPAIEPHEVTLRFDTVSRQNGVKVELKAPVAGLHVDGGPGVKEATITLPASVTIDPTVDAVMIDGPGFAEIRVAFEKGASQRESALRIAGYKMMLRRNADGDLVMGARVMNAPGRD